MTTPLCDTIDPAATPARVWRGRSTFEEHLTAPTMRRLVDLRSGSDAVYLRCYSGGRQVSEWSFAAFAHTARSLAHVLAAEHGVRHGSRVLVATGNSAATALSYAALWSMGAVSVMVNPTELKEKGAAIVAATRAILLIVEVGSPADLAIDVCVLTDERVSALREQTAGMPWPEGPEPATGTPALIGFTSGTTGHSKGVVLDHGNLLINAEATRRMHAMDDRHVHMCVMPLFHVLAMNFSFLSTFYSGSRLILNRALYLPEFWRIANRERPNVVSLVPLAIQTLIDDRRSIGSDEVPDSLAYATTGAAPMSAGQLQRFRDRYELRILQCYGLTETVNFALNTPPDLSDAGYARVTTEDDRPASGVPVFGNDVAIVAEDGTPCGPREQGEIVIRGWNVMQGYLDSPDANRFAFRSGWFHTGDRGWWQEVDGRRFFYVAGRIKETIKRRGESVSLLEIDEFLQAHGEFGVAAVGFENRWVGEEIGLFVEGPPDPGRERRLLSLCAVLGILRPRAVAFGPAISRTATGKIQRTAMSAAFSDMAERDFDGEARLR